MIRKHIKLLFGSSNNSISKRILSFFLVTSFLIGGCNITYKVRNQHNDIDHLLHTPCGKVTIELIGRGNSKFLLKQRFDLDEEVQINLDSLKISCNYKEAYIEHNLKGNDISTNSINISGSKTWEASFDLDKGVFEGDTIIVYGGNYISCLKEDISLDTLTFSFINNLRIKGVNDF